MAFFDNYYKNELKNMWKKTVVSSIDLKLYSCINFEFIKTTA